MDLSFLPFEDRPLKKEHVWPPANNKSSRSLSRMDSMTVGDVRQCFSQMRSTFYLSSNTILWCGLTAGEFALQYLINTSGLSRKKRTRASTN